MNPQTTIPFPSANYVELVSQSPVNTRRMGGQNLRLFNFLMTGQRINVFSKAKHELRIGYLNSRCSDLINVHRIDVQSEYVSVKDIDGADVQVKEYWMNQEEINRFKRMGK